MDPSIRRFVTVGLAATLCMSTLRMLGADALHERVDKLIAAKAAAPGGGPLAPAASDAEFLRRVCLDLNGTIPSSAEARQFLADTASDKRAKLIDHLLASPDYAAHMAEAFNIMLMERRTHSDAPSQAWLKYLQSCFAANKPWDVMAREILCPNPDDETTRYSALFYIRRLEKVGQNPTDYQGLTRDLGRLFMGVDLKCAECHNHKYIKDYKQADYQGLFAFVGQTFIRTDVKHPAIGEKPLAAKREYVSVFHPADKKGTGPRIPFGTEMEVPAFPKGQEWATPPDTKTKSPGVPKFATLPLLAEQFTKPENVQFKRNIANRLWFLMMGRGLIHPLDLAHSENLPSHPELLTLLADEFEAMKFDIKALVRELALSQTYQRSSVLPAGSANVPAESYRVAIGKRMSGELIAHCGLTASGELEAARQIKEEKPKAKVEAAAGNDDPPGGDEKKPVKGPIPLPALYQHFVSAFSGPAGEPEVEFAPSVAGALFMSNDQIVLNWLKPRSGNLVDKLSKLDTPAAIADELYLSILTRFPTEDERADVASYLQKQAKRRDGALGDLAWALMASTEFCLNH